MYKICLIPMCFLAVTVFSSVELRAQKPQDPTQAEQDALVNAINLRLHTLQVALSESKNLDSELELVEDQRTSLKKLSGEYEKLVSTLLNHEKIEGGMEEGLALYFQEMDVFDNKLSNNILLPHQTGILRSMVFKELLIEVGGDLISAASVYYPTEFVLNKAQEKALADIKADSAEKVKLAKKEYEEKLKSISSAANTKIRTVLSPKQVELLRGLQNR